MMLRRGLVLTLVCAALCVGFAPSARAQDDAQLRSDALAAIFRAQQFLIGQQQPSGAWEHNQPAGLTSLVLTSLLYSGMTTADRPVRRGLQYLRSLSVPDNTYDVSLMILAFTLANDGDTDREHIRALVRWLIQAQHGPGDPAPGSWGYKISDRGGHWDNSNSQFAILGLREAANYGIDVPREVWRSAQQHWMGRHGGSKDAATGVYWYYHDGSPDARGSMTVAGITSLTITSTFLRDDSDVGPGGAIDCCAFNEDDDVHATIEAGLRWLGNNFSVADNPNAGRTWTYYYLYGLERAGRFSGRRFVALHDWYREGVRRMVAMQDPRNGSWYIGNSEPPVIGTPLALLFLAKGNSPILINKLKYGDDKGELYGRGWNKHPRDVGNLTDAISIRPRWPKLLTWQVADLAVAAKQRDRGALLQAKVQYLSGDGPLTTISDAEVKLLREYIDEGGFLFAVNTCGGREFDQGIRQLVARMYPEGDFKLQKLPETHDIYRSEHVFTSAEGVGVPELWGVDIGCRTAIVYSPDDLACRWDKWMRSDPPQRQLTVKTQIKRAMDLAVNVIAYATGRELLDALTEPVRLPEIAGGNRGKLEIVRLRHTGGWDTAPNALRHLQLGLQAAGIATSGEAPNVSPGDPALFDFPLAYMHGRTNFRLSEVEQAGLKKYLDQGGFLFADASCGAPPFDDSFRKLIKALYGRDLEPIPLDHELIQSKLGYDVQKVRRRLPLENRAGAPVQSEYAEGPPILEGIKDAEGRYLVVYSKYDLSCALERQATVSCAGYATVDAARIATNIVLYSLSR